MSSKPPKRPQRRVVGDLERDTAEATAKMGLALAHPLRVQILLLLLQEVGSSTTLANSLGVPLGNVSYHLKDVLDKKCGVVAKVRDRQVRGALETFYRIDAAAFSRLFKPLQGLPAILQVGPQSAALVAFIDQAAKAVKYVAEGGELRQGFAAWRPGPVDQEGWDEINAALAEAETRISRAVEDSVPRLTPESEINAVFGVGAFQLPPPVEAA